MESGCLLLRLAWIDPTSVLAGFIVGELEIGICRGCGSMWVVGGVEGSWVEELHVGSSSGDGDEEQPDGEVHIVAW